MSGSRTPGSSGSISTTASTSICVPRVRENANTARLSTTHCSPNHSTVLCVLCAVPCCAAGRYLTLSLCYCLLGQQHTVGVASPTAAEPRRPTPSVWSLSEKIGRQEPEKRIPFGRTPPGRGHPRPPVP